MKATGRRGTSAIRLDAALHKKLFAAIGLTSLDAVAAAVGVNRKTVWRARNGGTVGDQFVAKTMAALQAREDDLRARGLQMPRLDDLFEVVVTTKRA